MLRSLRIENFALIDSLELELEAGFTVLTGETGAGKSIILDAIDAALGGKVSGRSIRTGCDRALIEATFQSTPRLDEWLQSQKIATHDGTLVCSREIVTGSQRHRTRINGTSATKQQMEHLRDRLVEITAQGQTIQLGDPALQRQWLDSYGGPKVLKQRDSVATAHVTYQQALQALEKRRKAEEARLQQLDLFEYQLKDLSAAQLTDADELDQLELERKRLSHSVELQHQSYAVYQMLYENDRGSKACADLLGQAEQTLRDMVGFDESLQPLLEQVNQALDLVQQASREMNIYGETLEADPQRLQEVEERIVALKQICRKYGPTLGEAIALYESLQAQMNDMNGNGHSLADLEATCEARHQELTERCQELTRLRQHAAHVLEERLVNELKPLAMEKVQFQVEISEMAPTAMGSDRITFMFSPNPGEPMQPLIEIASGGEMSRFLLALQSCFSAIDGTGTLVFDEIDTGVSGRVTSAIAEKLYQLSQPHQVLCVTHQAIVAAMADQHLHVSKHLIDERTVVRVSRLNDQDRREELAQLAGGQTAQEAIAFADALLNQAATLRNSPEPSESVTANVSPKSSKPRAVAKRSKTASSTVTPFKSESLGQKEPITKRAKRASRKA